MAEPLHLHAVDVWETLRRAVLERSPALSGALAEPAAADWTGVATRERGVCALACMLDLDPAVPAMRRQARVVLADFERDGLLPDSERPAMLSEDPAPAYHDLALEKRQSIAADIEWVMSAAFTEALLAAAGPVGAVQLVEKKAKNLRGVRAPRFLAALGYPVVVPEKARRRWLHRFGLIPDMAETQAARLEAIRVFDRFCREAGVAPREFDAVLGAFTESSRSEDGAAFCSQTPRCRPCPLKARCHYGRFVEEHGVVNEEKGGRRNLAEAFLPEDRPREKLLNQGAEGLTNAELLAILLRTGNEKEHAVELANRVLRTAGSLDRLQRQSVTELTRIPGLGPVKAITIKAALELARRLATAKVNEEAPVSGARDVFERLRGFYLEKHKEVFVCLMLNVKNRITRQIVISEGTLNQSLVHPREAFQEAVRDSAAFVIFAHNHPSGDPTPSRDDKIITERLVDAGEIMGVRVLDHIIVGKDRYYSFADDGKLKGSRG